MTDRNKILLYLDGQLSEKEKIDFENELKNSPGLLAECENLKNKFSFLKNLNDNIELDDSYFVNLVPKVRQGVEKKNKRNFIPAFAASTVSVILIAVVLIFSLNKKENINMNSLQQLTQNMSNNELEETLNLLNPGIIDNSTIIQQSSKSDSLIDQALVNELTPSINSRENFLTYDDSDLNSYINDLNVREADQIYNEIMNKKYF